MRLSRLLAALCPIFVCAQTPSVLNMSKDLVTYGIATSNLTPNTSTVDAGPLFEAAVAYATKNTIPLVTADPGNYYFLALHNSNPNAIQHVLLSGATNLTIDWQNSDLYFAKSNRAAIQCTSCTSVTLENFTLDYQQLPFTQVTVTAVDAANRNLTFQTIPGYQSPSDFNARRAPPSYDPDAIWMFAFHNGAPLPQTGRLASAPPFSANMIHVTADGLPWTAQSSLAAIQPGDTLVLTDRGGPPAINVVNGQNDTVRNVTVYASGQIGIYFGRTLNPTADRNQVIPRPGTDRLISTNADGIHTSFSLANTTFSNNIVHRTCDDALAIATEWIATIAQPGDGKTIVVTQTPGAPLPVGAPVSFISLADASVLGTANIAAETIGADSTTLVLDHAITGLAQGYGVMDADPAKRASGSVIRNNTVQEGVFARGIWLSGVENVTVTDNLVQRTSNTGILVQESISNNYFSGPSSGITIKNNIVDNAISYGPPGAGVILSSASINVVAANSKNAEVLTTPHSDVTITGNRVTNSPRSAIRMGRT